MTLSAPRAAAAALLLASACTDRVSPLIPPPEDLPASAIRCSVVPAERTMRCDTPEPGAGGARGDLILGGQDRFVKLAASGFSTSAGRISFDVTVQNLIGQPIGTTNGRDADPEGVRVFFHAEPVGLPGGAASLGNPDGHATFTGSAQPFFRYDALLLPGETSAPRTWEIAYTEEVERIVFTVYVAGAVPHPAEWVDVSPERRFLLPGDTARFAAVVRDALGRPLEGAVLWSSSDTTIATVDSAGLVRAVRLGIAHVSADRGDASGGAPVIVVTRETAVTMDVTPDSATLEMNETVQLTARTYNLRGEPLDDYAVWADGNIHVAVVDGAGLVRGTYPGRTSVMGAFQWAEDVALITVLPGPEVAWQGVSAGHNFSCGVTTTNTPYCWGANTAGQLGIGMFNQYGENIPVRLAGNYAFASVSAGYSVSCAASGGPAFCWGSGYYGQLGNGSTGSLDPVTTPVEVTGGHRFARVAAGWEHACGIRLDGAAYCWGNNTYGQLGNGTFGTFNPEGPVAVEGGLAFREISAGRGFNCAITTGDDLYCWGDNNLGQLGDGAGGPAVNVPEPSPVAGGRKWKAVSVWDQHACGLTTEGEALCWGVDRVGELGRGTVGDSTGVPAPIASTERFVGIAVGSRHSCAVAATGTAYCWGYNDDGQLGRGTKDTVEPHPVPQPVLAGVSFAGPIDLGQGHSCALGVDGRLYCWGRDFDGEAGVQPDVEFCYVPGGTASCQTRPRPVENPAAGGVRTGPVP